MPIPRRKCANQLLRSSLANSDFPVQVVADRRLVFLHELLSTGHCILLWGRMEHARKLHMRRLRSSNKHDHCEMANKQHEVFAQACCSKILAADLKDPVGFIHISLPDLLGH
ncbi:unnamed protein product [Fraxinus pennsylvanica]|uniref:Uncharacterized protein n=1 Tax=Fraxinus pennsylvanica TaxID=56036 RepID=A0AAD2DLG3_9LAMI|nr:unnamed protein product [Fraxinus pennsylvanica]